MPNHKPKKSKAAKSPQAEIRQLKRRIRWLEYENGALVKAVNAYIKKEMMTPEARAEMEALVEREVAPLLRNPDALEAALKGPTILDVISEFKRESRKKRRPRRKGA